MYTCWPVSPLTQNVHVFNECYKCSDTQNCLNTIHTKDMLSLTIPRFIAPKTLTSMYIRYSTERQTQWQAQHFKYLCFCYWIVCFAGLFIQSSISCNWNPRNPLFWDDCFPIEQPYQTVLIQIHHWIWRMPFYWMILVYFIVWNDK